MNITVKNIPDSIYKVMKREAKKKRRSLNAEIIRVLEANGWRHVRTNGDHRVFRSTDGRIQ